MLHAPAFTLHPDRWGAQWSANGVLLRFSDGKNGVAWGLEPGAGAQLATDLAAWLQAHEKSHGVLWSEDALANGHRTRTFLREHAPEPNDQHARSQLLRHVQNLPLQGFERSFKLQPHALYPQRFLVGLPTQAIALADALHIARQLNCPDVFQEILSTQWGQACFLHFGIEEGAHDCLLKMYLEFARQPHSPAPLYRGLKWRSDDPTHHMVSNYAQPVAWDAATLLANTSAACADTTIGQTIADIITLAMGKVPASELLLVMVHDANSPRTSFDLNLYPAQLQIRDIAPLLEAVGTYWQVPAQRYARTLETSASDTLGHLSSGINRHGEVFLTIYHTPNDVADGESTHSL